MKLLPCLLVEEAVVCREVQGPAMAITAMNGLLLVGWGARLDAFAWTGQRLQTMCFHEADVMITSICHIKRYVVIGDLHKGVAFLQLAPDNHSFQNLSKVSLMPSLCCDLLGRPTDSVLLLQLKPEPSAWLLEQLIGFAQI